MLNKTILAGRLARNDRHAEQDEPTRARMGTLTRQELRKIIEEMLG